MEMVVVVPIPSPLPVHSHSSTGGGRRIRSRRHTRPAGQYVGGPTDRYAAAGCSRSTARDRCTMNALFTWVFLLSFKGAVQEMKIYASPEFADIQCTDLLQQVGARGRVLCFPAVFCRRQSVFSHATRSVFGCSNWGSKTIVACEKSILLFFGVFLF